MSNDKRKRYRYELTNNPAWRNIVPLLRLTDPDILFKWLKGNKEISPDKEYHNIQKQVKEQEQALNSVSTRIKTLDELLEHAEVDLQKWEVSSYTINAWESGSKNPSGVILPCTLYQVKAILKPTNPGFAILQNGIIEEIRKNTKPVPKITYPKTNRNLLIEMCVFDLHVGKVAYDESGDNKWNLKKVERLYDGLINDVLSRVDVSSIDRFLIPTGNDLLNIDSTHNATTRGTPQMSSNYWENLMLFTFKMLKRNIDKLSGIAPVYVPMVPGNHDEDSTFSLGGFLAASFEKNPNVFIDNSVNKRKCHCYGNNLIAYTHGNNLKARDLHSIMATEWPVLFGKTKYRAWRTGHLHTNRKSKIVFYDYKNEYQGVDVEICPSMTCTDRWHYKKGYIGNIRRSKSFVWDKSKGLIKELYFNL